MTLDDIKQALAERDSCIARLVQENFTLRDALAALQQKNAKLEENKAGANLKAVDAE